MGNQKNKDKRFDKSYIESKDILNTSWLYFQQHAQQRISYFNFFCGIFHTFNYRNDKHISRRF